MKRLALAIATLLVTHIASAQIYQWKDPSGKTIYSDKPPPGSVQQSRTLSATSGPSAAPVEKKSLADRDLEFRKRRQELQEKSDQAKKEEAAKSQNQESCNEARRSLQVLESGERVALRDDKGERYFMDDEQRKHEIEKTRQAIAAHCQ